MNVLRLATHAMGARFELLLPHDPDAAPRTLARLRAAGEEALATIEEQDRLLSVFRRDSLPARVFRSAHLRRVALDEDTFALLEDAQRVQADSRGAFDVRLGSAMERAGFRAASVDVERPKRDDAEPPALVLDARTRSLSASAVGLALDFGGIGKGHALDLARRGLLEHGVESAFLHGGSSCVATIGTPPESDAWRVAASASPGAPVVRLTDEALAVSGQHGRTNTEGQGHVLDPHSARPVASDTVALVVAPSARQADAWSTACLVCEVRESTGSPGSMEGLGLDPALATLHSLSILVGRVRPTTGRVGSGERRWTLLAGDPACLERPHMEVSA